MKKYIYACFAFFLLLSLMSTAGCNRPLDFFGVSEFSATQDIGTTGGLATAQVGGVTDYASFVAQLKAAGATVQAGDELSQPFFNVDGQQVTINGSDLQVFEYANTAAADADAALVSRDGGSVGTSMVSWIEPPHFYKQGRLIVLYLGTDRAILNLLSGVLGPQFAGR
jgi:hypothetical protein